MEKKKLCEKITVLKNFEVEILNIFVTAGFFLPRRKILAK